MNKQLEYTGITFESLTIQQNGIFKFSVDMVIVLNVIENSRINIRVTQVCATGIMKISSLIN